MVRAFAAAVAAVFVLAACGQASSPPFVRTVNGEPVSEAKACDSYVGQVLTQADAPLICADPESTGDLTYIQPMFIVPCDNGLAFLTLGETVGGIEGQKLQKLKSGYVLDRASCKVTEP